MVSLSLLREDIVGSLFIKEFVYQISGRLNKICAYPQKQVFVLTLELRKPEQLLLCSNVG